MATRLRHIAIIVPDPEASAKFFEEAFGMTRAGTARRGIYMTDGTMNVALLGKETPEEEIGLYHFGMWVDDLDAAEKQVIKAGGKVEFVDCNREDLCMSFEDFDKARTSYGTDEDIIFIDSTPKLEIDS